MRQQEKSGSNASARSLTAIAAAIIAAAPVVMTPPAHAAGTAQSAPQSASAQSASIAAPVAAPVADAGRTINAIGGTQVGFAYRLDGSGSQGDGLTYQWRQIAGSPSLTLRNPTADGKITVVVPRHLAAGNFAFELTVTDRHGKQARATTQVNITAPGVTIAGAARLPAGKPGIFTATTNLPADGRTFEWALIRNGQTAAKSGKSASAIWRAPALERGDYELRVTAFAASGSRTAAASQRLTVHAASDSAGEPPVADAGAGKTVLNDKPVGYAYTLDAGASRSPAGGPLVYVWEQTAGTPLELRNPTPDGKIQVVVPRGQKAGRFVFQVTVQDQHGHTATDDVVLTVKDPGDESTGALGGASTIEQFGSVRFTAPARLVKSGVLYTWQIRHADDDIWADAPVASNGPNAQSSWQLANVPPGEYQVSLSARAPGGTEVKLSQPLTVKPAVDGLPKGAERWRAAHDSSSVSEVRKQQAALLAGDTFYLASTDALVTAFDRTTGLKVWDSNQDLGAPGKPHGPLKGLSMDNQGLLYFMSSEPNPDFGKAVKLYAINTGGNLPKVVWSEISHTVTDFFGAGRSVYGIHMERASHWGAIRPFHITPEGHETHPERYMFHANDTEQRVAQATSRDGKMLYLLLASGDRHLVRAYELTEGEEVWFVKRWEHALDSSAADPRPGQARAGIAVGPDGTVYVLDYSDQTGATAQRLRQADARDAGDAPDDGNEGASDGQQQQTRRVRITALTQQPADPAQAGGDRATLWQVGQLDGQWASDLAADASGVYARTISETPVSGQQDYMATQLIALDARTGDNKWVALDGTAKNSLAVENLAVTPSQPGTVFSHMGGGVMALDADDGHAKWFYAPEADSDGSQPTLWTYPVVDGNGTLYIASRKAVYAIGKPDARAAKAMPPEAAQGGSR